MTDAMVSLPTLLSMGTSALIAIGLPFVLLFVWRKKTGAKYTAALVGAIIFPVFALILEAAFHRLFLGQLGSVSQFLLSNPIAYILYGGLMAGIFEETGRLIGFGWLLRKQSGKECGVMYGIGHGGIEAILLAGMSMVSNIVFCLNVNAQGAEAYLMALPPEQIQSMAGALQGILSANSALFLVSGIERIFAIVLHISLSVLVFTAVKRHRLWLYPAAIGLHACVDFIAVAGQVGFLTSLAVIEALVALATLLVAAIALMVYRRDVPAAEEDEAEETAQLLAPEGALPESPEILGAESLDAETLDAETLSPETMGEETPADVGGAAEEPSAERERCTEDVPPRA